MPHCGGRRAPGAWNRFAVLDVLRLTLIGRATTYGLSVAEATDLASQTIDCLTRYIAHVEPVPFNLVAEQLLGWKAMFARVGDTIEYMLGTPVDTGRHTWAEYVTINLGAVAEDVRERLNQLVTGHVAPGAEATGAASPVAPFSHTHNGEH